jgi:hypothetical protein
MRPIEEVTREILSIVDGIPVNTGGK